MYCNMQRNMEVKKTLYLSHACSIYSKRICMCTTEDSYTVSETKFITYEHFEIIFDFL